MSTSTPTTATAETQRAFRILSALPPDAYATIFKETDPQAFENAEGDLADLLRMLFHDAAGRTDAPVDRMAEGMAYMLTGDAAHVLGEPAGTPTAGDDEGEALRLIADLPAEARKWLISAEPDEGDRFDAELPGVLDHSISNMRGNGLSVVALARAACYLARSMTGEAADLPAPEPMLRVPSAEEAAAEPRRTVTAGLRELEGNLASLRLQIHGGVELTDGDDEHSAAAGLAVLRAAEDLADCMAADLEDLQRAVLDAIETK